ncbi:MAG: GNAT family N-acetyltransferase [Nitrospira sp.]|nr:GNAT family N-acetyltransferase [Nitrospira sp.]
MTVDLTVRTARLLLRPFQTTDAEAVHRLAGSQDVAAGTFLPHPMDRQAALSWITERVEDQTAGRGVTFAITLEESGEVIGAIGMEIVATHEQGRLSYWLGRPYWNRGYGTEAVSAPRGIWLQQPEAASDLRAAFSCQSGVRASVAEDGHDPMRAPA